MKLLVGDIIEGEVIDLGIEGEGVVKYGAYPIFVPLALPHEKVRVRLKYVKKDFAFGELIEVLSPSNERVKPRCCYFGKCGGCDLQHMSHALQLELKRQNVEHTLRRIGGFDFDVPAVISLNEWEYRNKLSLPFGVNGEGKVCLGFYGKRTHKVVAMKYCPLHGDWAADLIVAVTDWANENELSVYNETSGKGLLRHLVARKLETLSVMLVINGVNIPALKKLTAKLNKKFSDYALYVSENTENTNKILGDGARLVFGTERPQKTGDITAFVSPMSFFQVNDAVRNAIYSAVADRLRKFDGEIVELYSGVGLLTAELAARLPHSKIVSVEVIPDAVNDAKSLMKSLGFEHRVDCICDDATAYMRDYATKSANSAIVLDPPRKGCDESVLTAVLSAKFSKIIYISCNPATLARDLKILTSPVYGNRAEATQSNTDVADSAPIYTISTLQPYDMFPQTCHVETVCLMSRVKE